MNFLTVAKEKQRINQAVLAVPMALGPNDKLTPFVNRLNEENPDAVIWQADAIADDFSKEVIWDQVKQGGAKTVDDGDMSSMKKASMKAELEQAYQEFLANWPSIQQQIVQELVQNARQTAGERYLFLSYQNKEEGGRGEMGPADQAFFLTSALKVAGDAFSGVYVPSQLDENLQEKVRDAANEAGVPVILTVALAELTKESLSKAFEKAAVFGADFVNLECSGNSLSAVEVSDVELMLQSLADKYTNKVLPILTITKDLSKDQLEAWLVLPSALVTLALSEQDKTPLIQSTVRSLGWQ
ncbi:type I 3-dehydroquinate dehydratase [Fructobacillus sp. M1-13]|uniref:Type I 3-dehydroquinate dehydratase n=1 Tax=Fructobacillus papyriferae TaxID=2713171 RepID=A0ABS5QNM9_9LACO|nr:type I 3-dehydroquinate dehydratase [Fructobacillus papyriferae]MBS9334735.1 type I 3-dehydroquinate dehydratase [Fructobacillus papyriferae]MCD2158725.1 type I 3-dehydroquinate dehydratase [Fructobacillus papyriferae]